MYLTHDVETLLSDERRDSNWAMEMNLVTGRLHRNVTLRKPEPQDVVEMIPLLEKAQVIVSRVPKEGEYAEHIDDYARNIRLRIHKMRSYVRGEGPYSLEDIK
jgi:hypothetical protein